MLLTVMTIAPVVLAQERQQVSLPTWMAGSWETTSANPHLREHWEGPALGLMVGVNLSVSGERASFEFLRISSDGPDCPCLFASPSGRHPPTRFHLEQSSPDTIVFANPAHDFPQRSGYEGRQDGDLDAWIEGPGKDGTRRIAWRFRRTADRPIQAGSDLQ